MKKEFSENNYNVNNNINNENLGNNNINNEININNNDNNKISN